MLNFALVYENSELCSAFECTEENTNLTFCSMLINCELFRV